MSNLDTYLRTNQSQVDARLAALLAAETDTPIALLDAMRYSLLAPGKRLRPILVLMSAAACGGSGSDPLPAACAVEMVHTYSLIHDDLPAMDDDDLRRGLPTCHKKFGDALAILAGDALLTLAFQVLAEHYPATVAKAGVRELARGSGMAGMVGGQVEDLAWENALGQRKDPLFPPMRGHPSLEALERIHQLKTGALFRACLRLGAYVALENPEPALLDHLDQWGRCFGLIFQITDDLLDVEGTSAETGKRTQKDAARGKLTYPGLLGVEASRRHADELARQARGHLASFGTNAEKLHALLDYVLSRDR